MQPRLMRSRTEVVIAGVCGGLGEYFGVDPVIVRLIFVLVALTTGIGVLAYPILWMIMPRAPAPGFSGSLGGGELRQIGAAPAEQVADQPGAQVMHEVMVQGQAPSTQARSTYAEPPPPEAYNFDPLTGHPLRDPHTGQTTRLPYEQAEITPAGQPAAPSQLPHQRQAPPAPRRAMHFVGFLLLGIGALVLAETFGVDSDIIFPIFLIGAGLLLLRRR